MTCQIPVTFRNKEWHWFLMKFWECISVFPINSDWCLIDEGWWWESRVNVNEVSCKYTCKCLRYITWNFLAESQSLSSKLFSIISTTVWNESTFCFRTQGQLYKHSYNQSTLNQLVLVKERPNIQWLRKLNIQYSKDFNKFSELSEIKYLSALSKNH